MIALRYGFLVIAQRAAAAHSRSTLAKRAFSVLALTLAGAMLLATDALAAAGTNIGNAKELTGSASGELPNKLSDDWYVVYPSSKSETIEITAKNTTHAPSSGCTLLIAKADNSEGIALNAQDVAEGHEYAFKVSGSERYFVELEDNDCEAEKGEPTRYELHATGSFGASLQGSMAEASPGGSIGEAREALAGHVAYEGSIPNAITNQWLVFDVSGTSPEVTVRVSDTTRQGSTCALLIASLTDTFGTSLNSRDIPQNTAYTFTVSEAGRYFLHLSDNNCEPGGGEPLRYQVQADPAAGLSQPQAPPLQGIVGGATMASATGQLAGGIDYTDTIPTASTTRWYSLQANGSGQVQINVENTSQSNAPCGPLIVRFYNASGASLDGQDLADDTGYTFKVSAAGTYYISAQDNNCEPGEKPPTTLQIEITPPESVTPSPPFSEPSPPTCTDVSATTTSQHAVTLQLSCSGSPGPLTYVILSGPAHGTLSNLNPSTGTVTYTPAAKYSGSDSFGYNAATSTGLQAAEATATITVALSGNAAKKGEGDKPKGPGGKGKKAAGKAKGGKGKGKPLTTAQKKQLTNMWRQLIGEADTAIRIVDAAKKAIEVAAAYKTVRDVLHADKLIGKAINAGVELLKAAIDKAIEKYGKDPAAKTALETAKRLVGLAGKELKDAAKDEALDQVTDAAKKYIDDSRKRLEAIKRKAQQEAKRLSQAGRRAKGAQTRTMTFPVLPPVKSRLSASGACSIPSTMCSAAFS